MLMLTKLSQNVACVDNIWLFSRKGGKAGRQNTDYIRTEDWEGLHFLECTSAGCTKKGPGSRGRISMSTFRFVDDHCIFIIVYV